MEITEHDATTGESKVRDANSEEIAAFETYLSDLQTQEEKRSAEAEAKDAILTKLGLTEDEAKLLLS